MKKLIKKTAKAPVNFVRRHKGKILIGAIIGTHMVALKHRNEFIEEHGLTEEYNTSHKW